MLNRVKSFTCVFFIFEITHIIILLIAFKLIFEFEGYRRIHGIYVEFICLLSLIPLVMNMIFAFATIKGKTVNPLLVVLLNIIIAIICTFIFFGSHCSI